MSKHKRITKPLLELSLLKTQIEQTMIHYMFDDLKMEEPEVRATLARSRKNGAFDKAVSSVINEWWASY